VRSPDSIASDAAARRESDADLVNRALAGEPDAFARLFHTHKGRVYAICLRMTNNPADADDLTQEAFVQAFRKLATFRGQSALSTWLHHVAVNTALMHFRRRGAPETSLNEIEPGLRRREFARHDDRLKHSLDRIALMRALAALPFGYRRVFELHEIDGYGHREIAKLLRCSVGNSKSQLHKAKERMRECLQSRRRLTCYLQRRAAAEAAEKAKTRGVSLINTPRALQEHRLRDGILPLPSNCVPAETAGFMGRSSWNSVLGW
jgi:RNA polymerase sigma-70 factor (ECF subfamily)